MADQGSDAGSVPRRQHGFGVAASPLNAVKVDLGVLMVVGLLLLVLQSWVETAESVRIALLLLYGVAGMIWLIVRTRRVVKALESRRDGT
jgi:hypothetical protein